LEKEIGDVMKIKCPKCKGEGYVLGLGGNTMTSTAPCEEVKKDCPICFGLKEIEESDVGTRIALILQDELSFLRNQLFLLSSGCTNILFEIYNLKTEVRDIKKKK
jgi:hypothetical protein